MEVPFAAREVYGHSASVLRGLRLQREQAQFCDCVVRQIQNPSQLYPAHRCLLAASSPVLASILSCTGVLVELQAPCLNDFVLEFLLDYIYTGVLPSTCSQHTISILLSAACYLQMDELQEALDTWRQTDTEPEESTGSTHRRSNRNSANYCSRKDASANISTVNYIQVTNVTPQDVLQHSCCNTVEQEEARMDQGRRKNHGAAEPRPQQESREEEAMKNSSLCLPEELQEETVQEEEKEQLCLTVRSEAEYEKTSRKDEDDKSQSLHLLSAISTASPSLSFSSSSPSGASVPVICHSSTAAGFVHPHISQTSDYISSQNQGHRSRDEPATLSWDNKDRSDQRVIQDSCITAVLQQGPSSSIAHFTAQDDEDEGDGSPHHPDNNRKHHRVDSLMLNWEDFTIRHHPLEHYDILSATVRDSSFHCPGPLPVRASDTRSDCFSEDHTASSWRTDGTDRQDRHWNLYKLKTSCFPNSHRAEGQTEDINLSQHKDDRTGVCDPASASGRHMSFELEKISGAELTETHTDPANRSRLDPENGEGQSYSGHIHYHCLSQEDTYANTDHSGHFSPHSDPSKGDEEEEEEEEQQEEARTLTTGTDQVLLLDISAKPAEVLVSCGNRVGDEVDKKETNRMMVRKNDTGSKTSEATMRDEGQAGDGVPKTLTPVCLPPGVPGSAHTSRLPTWSVTAPSGSAHQLFQCSLCERSFSQRGSLNRHVRSHLGVRPFPCPRCPMTFSRQYRVTEHMRVHERCTMDPDLQKHPDLTHY